MPGTHGLQEEVPQSPLLLEDAVAGAIDNKGRPARRFTTGGWKAAGFVVGASVAERFAYFGIETNLINYLTGKLGQSTAVAAKNVNAWVGIGALLPLAGAFVADSYVGRYRTIVAASLLYILAMGLLTISAFLSDCQNTEIVSHCSPSWPQVFVFFCSLYLIAAAQGGYKPCNWAFGADQFDGQDPEESKSKSSYFNWWAFCVGLGLSVSLLTLSYVQDNLSWVVGFGLPCIAMVVALLLFLLGTDRYRYSIKREEKRPLVRIFKVFAEAARNQRTIPASEKTMEEGTSGTLSHDRGSQEFKFLNKALLVPTYSEEDGKARSVSEVEEAKAVQRLFPIWCTCLVYGLVLSQSSTFFIKQGMTMDRSVWSGLDIPAASLKAFTSFSFVLFVPMYEQVFIPIAKDFTGKPSGITMLQRIGTGLFLSTVSIAISVLVEMKRLETAQEFGLVDKPYATVPMKVWWLIPQYVLFGLSEVFAVIGLQELFYDQVPNDLRSVGVSLYLSIFGVGSFLSGFLISAIEKATGSEDSQACWFNDNLNRAHLNYFYGLLSGLSVVSLAAYLHCARSYPCNYNHLK